MAGVVDTLDKFATGINYNSGKFATDVNNAGDKFATGIGFPPVSTTVHWAYLL
jgi:hypothetical protein